MITTGDERLARRLRIFRNHGITSDHRERAVSGAYSYDMVSLGYNYRLTDIQAAIGLVSVCWPEPWDIHGHLVSLLSTTFCEPFLWGLDHDLRPGRRKDRARSIRSRIGK